MHSEDGCPAGVQPKCRHAPHRHVFGIAEHGEAGVMGRIFLKRILLSFIIGLLLSGLHGCSEPPDPVESSPPAAVKILRIGIIPEQDVFSQKERYRPLTDYVGQKLGINVELVMLSRYGHIIDDFTASRLDGAFFGSFTGAMAIKKLHVIPLARPEGKDGTSTYYGMILVRKDSSIRNGADMRGKRFAFVDEATTAGYLLPLYYFMEEGIPDYHSWFSETYFAGTHEDAIFDVLNRKADIGAAKNTVFYRFARKDRRLLDELEILATSPKVPENGLAVKRDFGQHNLTALKECLLEMDKDPEGRKVLDNFKAQRFIATSVADYQPVFDFAKHVGLDLATYQ
jgi:phosphonate transport system substrate-binding protein